MHFTPTARLRLTHRLPQLEGFAAPAPIIYNHSNKTSTIIVTKRPPPHR